MKKLLHGLLAFWLFVGVFVAADIVQSGSFEDSFTRTYILPNLKNIPTASLESTQLKGRLAFDSTLNVPTSDDGSGWRPMMTRYLSRTASHIEVTNASAPTLTSCTGGTVATGSTDTAGSVTGITGTSCIVNFNNFYNNSPFGVVTTGYRAAGIAAQFFTTGIEVYNLSAANGATERFNYLVIGRY